MHFSIVIPTYNSQKSIENTLESCVKQSCLPFEIIIVDDKSQDKTTEIVEKWIQAFSGEVPIQLITLTRNSGPSKARNIGWDVATGDYIAFLDADDLFLPEKLEKIVTVLIENKDMILIGHRAYVQDQMEKGTGKLEKISTRVLLKRNLFTTPSVVIKRTIHERFDETMRFTEDHDLWLRITQKYNKTYYLDHVLTVIDRPVRSAGGQSANLWAMRSGEVKMYRKYCKANGLMLLFPIFLAYSLSKHLLKLLKGSV